MSNPELCRNSCVKQAILPALYITHSGKPFMAVAALHLTDGAAEARYSKLSTWKVQSGHTWRDGMQVSKSIDTQGGALVGGQRRIRHEGQPGRKEPPEIRYVEPTLRTSAVGTREHIQVRRGGWTWNTAAHILIT